MIGQFCSQISLQITKSSELQKSTRVMKYTKLQRQLLPHQLSHNGRPEGHEMRGRELEQEHTKTEEDLRTDEWVPLELQVLGQLLCSATREP